MSRADAALRALTMGSALDSARAKPQFHSTALVSTDDAPSFDDDGYTAMRPSFDEADMLEALEDPALDDREAQLSPQQAYDTMKFQAPLSDGERSILNETPFLGPDLTFVDDPDHNEWLLNRMKEKGQAMDNVLEDQMYGDPISHLAGELRAQRRGAITSRRRAPSPRQPSAPPVDLLGNDHIAVYARELRRQRMARAVAQASGIGGDILGALRSLRGA